MKLQDLFVSFKQVNPVEFEIPKPLEFNDLYTNLNRVQQVTSPSENIPNQVQNGNSEKYDWVVKTKYNQNDVKTKQNQNEVQPKQNSSRLLNFLKEKEGFRSEVYSDSGGVKTIGYGFTDPNLTKRGFITEQEASDILSTYVNDIENKLKSQIVTWDKLNQNQKESLISYGFNVGVSDWSKTQPNLLKALNEGRFSEAAQYMDVVKDRSGNILPGLQIRRKQEQEWFNS